MIKRDFSYISIEVGDFLIRFPTWDRLKNLFHTYIMLRLWEFRHPFYIVDEPKKYIRKWWHFRHPTYQTMAEREMIVDELFSRRIGMSYIDKKTGETITEEEYLNLKGMEELRP